MASRSNSHPNQLPFATSKNKKTAVVTGANSGVGYNVVLHMYMHGWRVFMGCRNQKKVEKARESIYKEYNSRKHQLPPEAIPGELEYLSLDYSNLKSIPVSAAELISKVEDKSIDVLVNNAGVMALPAELTNDGYDIQTQTNHVGPWLFTQLLIPHLKEKARVIWISSLFQYLADPYVSIKRNYHLTPNIFWTFLRYGNSKTANVHSAITMAEKYPYIISIAIHPGFSLFTGMLNHYSELPRVGRAFDIIFSTFQFFFGVSQEEMAFSPLKAAMSREIEPSDEIIYLTAFGKKSRPSRRSSSKRLAKKTWDWTEQELLSKGFIF